ncbi:hypothetical protein BRADI_2g22902v3 [Brachypodium distachyon]|uniref:Type 1 phosphatases regulator n=1 Tax=Brachypodium distachyon TaxID=15368 RepID=A0A0Q3G3K1_BRADI|nr:hypothetical protein BRADI_2g22902v3 [Brachypodium distachyon]
MAARAPPPSSSSSGSATVTIDRSSSSSAHAAAPPPPPETVVLRLKRRAKKKVSWKEGTVDNESLGRKSSKKCCIFHKEVPFDEDCSDDDADRNPPADHGGDCSSSSHGHGQSHRDHHRDPVG